LKAKTPMGHANVAHGHPWQLNPGEQAFLKVKPNIPRLRSHVAAMLVIVLVLVRKPGLREAMRSS
jgi:hypothetical protein